jgi:hypothetical protein
MNLPLQIAALVLLAQQGTAAPTTKTFTEPYVGLSFNYPATWKIVKQKRDHTAISMPIPDSSDVADLEIQRTQFHQDKDLWQTIQLRINEQLKRTVTRQWDQEILDVPMLLTRIDYVDKGTATSATTGLLYTRTDQKFLFRLTAPHDSFDKAEYQLESALQSLRTVDGSLPKADDPNVKLDTPKKLVAAPLGPQILTSPAAAALKPILSPVKVDTIISTKKVTLRFPEGWTVTDKADSSMTLTHVGLSAPLKVSLASDLDSDPAPTALDTAAASTLDQFQTGPFREDRGPVPNHSAALIAMVWRVGKDQKGAYLSTFAGTCQSGDFYFVVKYQQTNPIATKGDRKLIDDLMDLSCLVPEP